MEKRQGKVTSPAGGVGGAGIGSRKGRGPAPVGRTGAVQLYPPGVQTHKRNKKTEQPGNSGLFCHYVDVNMC